jgi:glycosyltransferase involved in cell wall biosynthesis
VLTPRITVGIPVYKGVDLIPKALECLKRQSFGNFEAIISVDGNDLESAAACRPFLADRRFRMVIHPERLDWVGNFNWLLQQDLKEFFCYRQHDDTTAPEFFEVLLKTADKEPKAASVYCDCQYEGGSNGLEIVPSIEGDPLDRMVQYIERTLPTAAPIRGLIRRAAIEKAGLVRSDEMRAPFEVFVWLAKLLYWGNFKRIAKPLYYRLDHPKSFTSDYFRTSEDRKRAILTTLFTGLLQATMPVCRTPEERLFFQHTIVDRIVACWTSSAADPRFLAECLERLRHEGNTHLLNVGERCQILEELQRRLNEDKVSRIKRVAYRARRRAHMGNLIYPGFTKQRLVYELRRLSQYNVKRLLGGTA